MRGASYRVLAWLLLATAPAPAGEILAGAGATFPDPLYRRWVEAYARTRDVRVRYEAVGSGQGIRRLLDRTVDFGATDAFLTAAELEAAPAPILHVPSALGAVAISYNLPGDPVLDLTPDLVADIFLGRIRTWSDPRLGAAAGKVRLPSQEIAVVHRADSSGTTFVLTDYLTKVNARWRSEVGRGKTVRWPVGMGVDGNVRVADTLRQIPGSFGYVEFGHAQANRLPAARLRNRSGRFVAPTLAAVSAAAAVELPEDTRVSITDTAAADGYPVSSFTWIILYREQAYDGRSRARAAELQQWLWWMSHDGQAFSGPLGYGSLPTTAVHRVEVILRSMTHGGGALDALPVDAPKDGRTAP